MVAARIAAGLPLRSQKAENWMYSVRFLITRSGEQRRETAPVPFFLDGVYLGVTEPNLDDRSELGTAVGTKAPVHPGFVAVPDLGFDDSVQPVFSRKNDKDLFEPCPNKLGPSRVGSASKSVWMINLAELCP
jgi:hypothetical protein